MKSTPILQGKHAVVFGAGGSIGSAVAREFAREGAEVFLSGRSKSSVEPVAEQIVARGGTAHIDVLDTSMRMSSANTSTASQSRPARSTSCSTLSDRSLKSTETPAWLWTCRSIQDTTALIANRRNITKDQAMEQIAQYNFLKVSATVQDTANAAVLIASDRASMLTGTVVNATAGAALD